MTISEAIEQIDWTKMDVSQFAAKWVETYRKWRDEGHHNEIKAHGLVAIEATPSEMGWDEFLADHTGEWISYSSGTGKLWVIWAEEYLYEWSLMCRHFVVQEVAAMMGIVDEQAIDDLSDNNEVSVKASECDEPDLVELILEAVMAACGFDGTESPENSGCR